MLQNIVLFPFFGTLFPRAAMFQGNYLKTTFPKIQGSSHI